MALIHGRDLTPQTSLMKLLTRIHDAAIGADVLIGLPGETDAAFENTLFMMRARPYDFKD
ncbi:MAG: hypothetical protein GY859_18350 [Desulfobacterales bacterium]|nr:hypothetical protein [Desulfobacterales bacterium]